MIVIDVEEAAQRLNSAQRVLVIGCSGSGKSTLSSQLSARLGLPHISMDKEFVWLPGWQLRDQVSVRQLIAEVVKAPRWVMDGNSPRTLDLRLPRTDMIIWMRPGFWVSLKGVTKRVCRFYGRVRPDMANGCPERMPDWNLLGYIWNFEKKMSPRIEEKISEHGKDIPMLVLRSHAETAKLLGLIVA